MLFNLPPALVAGLTGFLSGFLLSVPVGPVNLTIMNEGARRGLLWAWMIGIGAVAMEVIYCALAFTGFAAFFDTPMMKAGMELASFVFMLYLGVLFLSVRKVEMPTAVEERIKKRLNPHSAFAIGFVRVMANPGVFAFWIVLAANFISHGWVQPTWPGKLFCVAGVAAGTSLWFSGLSYAVSRGHRKFTERTLLRMEHCSGFCMLALALIHGGYMAWQMAKHRI
ncbi:MAG: LysE family transporter [Verrucomicrobiota bacterium]|jgi:threonine/homoserine/homoserine lactone efflux protein